MPSSHEMSRSDFVKVVVAFLGTVMGAIIGIPALDFIISPAKKVQKADTWIPLGLLEKIPIGVPTPFTFTRSKVNGWEKTANSYGIYAWRKNADEVKVFSNVCTHLSCRVTWNEEKQLYICPCHDGRFDLEGNVTDGPPPRPLKLYEIKIDNGTLFIHFLES